MSKKKLILYGAMILTFLVFWSGYTIISMRSADEVSRQVVMGELTSAEGQYHKSLAYQAKDLKLALFGENGGSEIKTERLFAVLSRLEMQMPGRSFFALLGDNGLYSAEGVPVDAALKQEVIQQARREGYAVFSPTGALGGSESIAMIVPASDDLDGYFIQVQPVQEFARALDTDISISTSYLALFDSGGTQTAVVSSDWDEDILSADPATLTRREAANYNAFLSVQTGATDYASGANRESLHPQQQDYNIYIALGQPYGWILGGRVSTSKSYPIQSGIFQVTMLAFACWIIMIGIFITLDIILDRQKRRELYTASSMDALTKLSNSAAVENTVNEFFRKHDKIGYSMVCLDIVAFHRFNTLFGHDAGNRLLQVIAGVLGSHYHCGTRMSADVFIFLAENSKTLVPQLERRLGEAIQQELGRKYYKMIDFKIGVYPIIDPTHTFHEIYDGALLALKDAKKTPEQKEVIYDLHLQRTVDIERTIEMNMLQALANEEFLVYIQPKFIVATQECCGGEALVRWQSSQMGFMPPDAFVSIFERNGFIVEIDFYMLDKVLSHLQRDLAKGSRAYPISVNMSKITLTYPGYLERLRELVQKYDVSPDYVELEITESVLERTGTSVITLMNELRAQGFSVSMDDFGSGFSSLNSLRELPVDTLKIDKEFLRQSDESDRSKKIIKSIINMAKELGISVVCEGVENDAQFYFLKDAGCDIAQGYYFSKPMPYEQYKRDYILPAHNVDLVK